MYNYSTNVLKKQEKDVLYMAVLQNKNKKTKDGRTWYYTYSILDSEGNTIRTSSRMYLTKKEAQLAEASSKTSVTSEKFKRFSDIAEDYLNYLSKIRKQSTVYTYKKDYKLHLANFFGKRNIYTITVPIIRIWAESLDKKNLSISYKNKVYSLLKSIFDYAIKNYNLNYNPAANYGRFQKSNEEVIKNKDKLRYLTKEEFDKFISVVDEPLWHCFFMSAYYTGCRKGELLALSWEDIDFGCNIINVDKTLNQEIKGKVYVSSNKTNHNRRIQLSKLLKEELLKYKAEVMKYSDFSESWYVFGNSTYLPKTTVDRYKKMYFKESGVHEITMHEFRHSHVSLLINEYLKTGQTDTTKFFLMMSDRLGHSLDVMEKTYMHLFPTVQDEIVNILDNL